MSYQIEKINEAVRKDVQGFLDDCDTAYALQLAKGADHIANKLDKSKIVLLSGPSASGKTTSALKIEEELKNRGIRCHTVSMDNYFRTLTPDTVPRTPEGTVDLESPTYVDMPLLTQHFDMLEEGKEIMIPYFDFPNQRRNEAMSRPLKLEKNEVVIFEGIHALNDDTAGRHLGATGIFVAPRTPFTLGDDIIFQPHWLRMARRSVRDFQFRGTSIVDTLEMWKNVRRGETLYIDPYKHRAEINIDSAFPYEVGIMKHFGMPMLESALKELPEGDDRIPELLALLNAFSHFEAIDHTLLKANSLLREFVGGGSYSY